VCVLYAEVYAEIAQEFPDQVLHIFIHHVNGTNEVLLFVSLSF
jgi:phosphatidate phosphatase APP1